MAITNFAQARSTYELAKADVASLGHSYADAEIDFYADAEHEAIRALLLAPAPDLAAVAYKIEVFVAEDCAELSRQSRDALFAQLLADLNRIGRLLDS